MEPPSAHPLPGTSEPRPKGLADRRRDVSLADEVYERLLARIVEAHYPTGSRLPPETLLSGELGVSRPVLRQALTQLREDGIIRSQRGSGSYVERRPDRAMLRFAPVGSVADIGRTFEFRATIESEAAALAACRWKEAAMASLEAALDELDRCIAAGRLGAEADDAFHLAVCAAADNHYFLAARASLKAQILAGMNVARGLSLAKSAERLALVQDEHRAILLAIRGRDAEAARAAMRRHIENARSRVFEG